MKVTIEPTGRFFMAGDVMVRMWNGQTEGGEPVTALVAAVVFTGPEELAEDPGLVSIPPPDHDSVRRWAEQVLRTGGVGALGEG